MPKNWALLALIVSILLIPSALLGAAAAKKDTGGFVLYPMNPDPNALKKDGHSVSVIQTADKAYAAYLVDHKFVAVAIRLDGHNVAIRNTFYMKDGSVERLIAMSWKALSPKGTRVFIRYKKKEKKVESILSMRFRNDRLGTHADKPTFDST